jgi:carboxymethylenebutenolidase
MRNPSLNLLCVGTGLLLLCAAATLAAPSAFSQTSMPQNAQTSAPQNSEPSTQQRGGQGWAAQQRNQAWATQKLAKSPRRTEWVTTPSGNRTLKAFVTYPEVRGKVPVVIVLHEVFGLTDSTRNTADEIAAMGYITIAADMLSGYGPNGGNIDSFEPPLSASQTVTGLNDEAVNSDLNAWADYGAKLPGSNGKFAIVGLSWGGGAAFRYVTTAQRKDLKAVCVFYDIGPPAETQHFSGAPVSLSVVKINVPVYGFYGSTDTRPLVTLEATKAAMAAAGKVYDPLVYEGADHAFMRVGEDPGNRNPANPVAVQASLARLEKLLKETLK